jgi:hypothetical protein
MKMMLRALLVLAALTPNHVWAQGAILQSGPATPNHLPAFVTNGIVKDSGMIPIIIGGPVTPGDCLLIVSATPKLITLAATVCGSTVTLLTSDNGLILTSDSGTRLTPQ